MLFFLTLEGCYVVLLMFIVFVNVCTFSGGLEGRVWVVWALPGSAPDLGCSSILMQAVLCGVCFDLIFHSL